MTATQLKQLHRKLKTDIVICPLCKRDIMIPRTDPDIIEYVKTSTGGINVYHWACVEKENERGLGHK